MQQLINLMFYHIIHLTCWLLLFSLSLRFEILSNCFFLNLYHLWFNFLCESIYCCFFSSLSLEDVFLDEEEASQRGRNHRFYLFLRGSFVSFIYISTVCFHFIQTMLFPSQTPRRVCYGLSFKASKCLLNTLATQHISISQWRYYNNFQRQFQDRINPHADDSPNEKNIIHSSHKLQKSLLQPSFFSPFEVVESIWIDFFSLSSSARLALSFFL